MSKKKNKTEIHLPKGELKVVHIDCPQVELVPVPQEEMAQALASFFNLKVDKKKEMNYGNKQSIYARTQTAGA